MNGSWREGRHEKRGERRGADGGCCGGGGSEKSGARGHARFSQDGEQIHDSHRRVMGDV